jgi:hypothetical protein
VGGNGAGDGNGGGQDADLGKMVLGQLHQQSWVKINRIRTLSVERLSRKSGSVTPEELD